MKTSFRLDKYLADMSVGTRSEVKNLIKKGLVTVNGEVIRKPEYKVDIERMIWYAGESLLFIRRWFIICLTSRRGLFQPPMIQSRRQCWI